MRHRAAKTDPSLILTMDSNTYSIFAKILKSLKISQKTMTIYYKGVFLEHYMQFARFGQNDRRVFMAAEIECVIKIEVAPFVVALGSIFARNLGITRER